MIRLKRLPFPSTHTWHYFSLSRSERTSCTPPTCDISPCNSSATDASWARLRFTFGICNTFVESRSVSHCSQPTFDIISLSLSLCWRVGWRRTLGLWNETTTLVACSMHPPQVLHFEIASLLKGELGSLIQANSQLASSLSPSAQEISVQTKATN